MVHADTIANSLTAVQLILSINTLFSIDFINTQKPLFTPFRDPRVFCRIPPANRWRLPVIVVFQPFIGQRVDDRQVVGQPVLEVVADVLVREFAVVGGIDTFPGFVEIFVRIVSR